MADINYYKLVEENAEERKDLTDRQDADVLLRNLDSYVMKDIKNVEMSGVVNVTLNRPKVVANYIIAALSNTSEQILVESEEKDFDPDYIKDFRRLAFAAADARLRQRNMWRLNPYLDEQTCMRGGDAVRCYFQMVDGVLQPDIAYWDYRYVNYAPSSNGLAWASFGYGTKRKKAVIESESWWEKSSKPNISKAAEVVDILTPEVNEIWIEGKKVFDQENDMVWPDGTKYVPVVIQEVSIGSMLSDADDLENHGESVFFLIRQVIPELNRVISIIQTHNLLTIKRPIQTPAPEGRIATPPKYEDVTDPGASSSTEPGNRTEAINLGDITNATQIALARIDRALEEGGLSVSQLGLLGDPAASGIALIQSKEGRDIIYLPRLKTKAETKQALGDMITAQVMQIGGTVEIGTPGHKRQFDTRKLEGQYEVTHKFSVKSLAIDAGLASLAAAYGNSMSEHSKRREIYQMDDPDGEERWLSYEEAGRIVPSIKLARLAEDLIALDKNDEAQMVADFAQVQLEQLLSGGVESAKPEPKKEPTQLVGLFSGATGKGKGNPPATEEVK